MSIASKAWLRTRCAAIVMARGQFLPRIQVFTTYRPLPGTFPLIPQKGSSEVVRSTAFL